MTIETTSPTWYELSLQDLEELAQALEDESKTAKPAMAKFCRHLSIRLWVIRNNLERDDDGVCMGIPALE